MATFTVTTLADSGTGSLRDAIALANASGGADTITFDDSLAGGTINLSSTLEITGELTIWGDIDDDNVADITLDGGGTTQIMLASADLIIDGLVMTRGSAVAGGAISATAFLGIRNSEFTNNVASQYGGAIESMDLVVEDSTFTGNTATNGAGGAIYSTSSIPIRNSYFTGNSAAGDGGAICASVVTTYASTFADNVSGGKGGALWAAGVTANNTTFYQNVATSMGDAAYAASHIELNDATAVGHASSGSVFVTHNFLVDNSLILGNTGIDFADSFSSLPGFVLSFTGLSLVDANPDNWSGAAAATLLEVFGTNTPVLADNGGPVPTIALDPVASNPAIDTGGARDDARLLPANDVPGLGTTAGDIGAYEYYTQAVSVDSSSADGIYWLGQTINVTVKFDQIVTVSGTPILLLETGTTDREASYVSGSGTNTLTFRYTVQSGDTASDLNFASTSALSLNGGTISGPLSDASLLSLPSLTGAKSLASQATLEVRGIAAPASPVVASAISDQSAKEDTAFSFVVPSGTFTDANGDTLTYTATSANGSALPSWLSFNATTRTFSGTPLNAHVGAITVRVTAADGITGTASDEFTITVANTNDAPTAVTLSANTIAENSAAGTVVGTLSVTDPDTGDTSVLSLIGGAGGRFALAGNMIVVADGAKLDFEDKQSYSITVRATDAAGATKDQTLTIDITDIDDRVIGGKGNNTLVGGAGDELIDGKAGDDRLTGGDGADTFKFGKGYGRDTITDFDPTEGDIIDLSGAVGIKNFRDLIKHHVEDTGKDLVITANDGSLLVLKGVDVDDLSKDCFLF
jgi:predicted outer membrane repeat protein